MGRDQPRPLRLYYRALQLVIRTRMLKQFKLAFRRRKRNCPLTDQRRNAATINSARKQSEQIAVG